MKKADLSINTIVIAVIAVLVLVVLVLVFTGKIDWFTHRTNDCNNLKGECMLAGACDAASGSNLDQLNCDQGMICCKLPLS